MTFNLNYYEIELLILLILTTILIKNMVSRLHCLSLVARSWGVRTYIDGYLQSINANFCQGKLSLDVINGCPPTRDSGHDFIAAVV